MAGEREIDEKLMIFASVSRGGIGPVTKKDSEFDVVAEKKMQIWAVSAVGDEVDAAHAAVGALFP